jgi:hypothetical protein
VGARFETARELSDEDRQTIVELARQALAPFQPKPEANPELFDVISGFEALGGAQQAPVQAEASVISQQ